MASKKHISLRKIENSGTAIFKEYLFFLNKNRMFLKYKIERFESNKTTLLFVIEYKFQIDMASN